MHQALARKLRSFAPVTQEDEDVLKRLCQGRPRHVGARQPIAHEGEELKSVPYVLRGWTCRYKNLEDGRSQIISFSIPGDLCGVDLPYLSRRDHSLRALTDAIILYLPHEELDTMRSSFPRLAALLRSTTLVQASIAQEWIVSLGQRSAKERCAHLICELFWRLRAVGMTKGNSFDFPVTQEQIGAAIGISAVHANRVLQELRTARLIEQHGKSLNVRNLRNLERAGLFTPHFLNLENENHSDDVDTVLPVVRKSNSTLLCD